MTENANNFGSPIMNLNSSISFDSGSLKTFDVKQYENSGNISVGSNDFTYRDWNTYVYPNFYPTYYYPVYVNPPEKNKFELAFKILSKMLEKKIIEKMTLKQFIEAINEIVTVI